MTMKPNNLNEDPGCDPISSRCVIWQGGDLPCIDLCNGDKVDNVIFKLATELCEFMAMFEVSNYDLSCLNLGDCKPDDFQALMKILIERICAGNTVPTEGGQPAVEGCPDCNIPVACTDLLDFPVLPGEIDPRTSVPIKEFVTDAGKRICELMGQISTIQSTLTDHEERIDELENAGDAEPPSLPMVTPTCVLPATPVSVAALALALEEAFCTYREQVGNDENIALAIAQMCVDLSQDNRLSASGIMSDLVGWNDSPINLAQTTANMWQAICDIRTAVKFIQDNCCDTGCSSIDLNIVATLNNPSELRLDFIGELDTNIFSDVIPGGSTIVLTDADGNGPQIVSNVMLAQLYASSTPLIIPLTAVDGSFDITIQTTYNIIDGGTGTVCSTLLQNIVLGSRIL